MTPHFARDVTMPKPPRRASFGARVALLVGPAAIVAWGMAAFGVAICWQVLKDSEVKTSLEMMRERAEVAAQIERVEPSGIERGGKDLRAVHYAFEFEGSTYRGVSYTDGPPPTIGSWSNVEFVRASPDASRLVGYERRTLPAWTTVLPAAFVVLGWIVAFLAFRDGRARLSLLENGRVGAGKLNGKKTGDELVTYRFLFQVPEVVERHREAWEAWAKRNAVAFTVAETVPVSDDAEEPFFYEADRPGQAVALDTLPVRVEGAKIAPRSWVWVLGVLFPLMFVAALVGFTISLFSVG